MSELQPIVVDDEAKGGAPPGASSTTDLRALSAAPVSPTSVNQRTPVYVSIELLVLDVSTVKQNFRGEAWANFWWQPSCTKCLDSLHSTGECTEDALDTAGQEWTLPKSKRPCSSAIFDNSTREELVSEFWTYDRESNIVWWNKHMDVEVESAMELERFPFDRQMLTCVLRSRKNFVPIGTMPGWLKAYKEKAGIPDHYNIESPLVARFARSITEWKCRGNVVHMNPGKAVYGYPMYSVRIERDGRYFVHNHVMPLFLIVALAITSFKVEFSDSRLSDRLSITLTLLLTSVAFKFAIASFMPVVSYQTLMDLYVILCYTMLTLVAIENTIVEFESVSEDVRDTTNLLSAIVFSVVWVGVHLYIYVASARGWFRPRWEHVEEVEWNWDVGTKFFVKRIKSKSD